MALETATYVSQLNASNPVAGDDVNKGDDHIRLVKQTIVNSFPNVTGAVNATHTELNYVDGVTSAIQTQLDGKLAKAGGTATGTISAPILTLNSYGTNAAGGALAGNYFLLWTNGSDAAYGIQVSGPSGGLEIHADQSGQAIRMYAGGTASSPALAATILNTGATFSGLVYGRGGGAGLGRITVSTGDPSGGADGDIWFKVA